MSDLPTNPGQLNTELLTNPQAMASHPQLQRLVRLDPELSLLCTADSSYPLIARALSTEVSEPAKLSATAVARDEYVFKIIRPSIPSNLAKPTCYRHQDGYAQS